MSDPRYPDVYVDPVPFVAVDAWTHLILETTAALRRHGVSEAEISEYRASAVDDAVYATTRWVSTERKARS